MQSLGLYIYLSIYLYINFITVTDFLGTGDLVSLYSFILRRSFSNSLTRIFTFQYFNFILFSECVLTNPAPTPSNAQSFQALYVLVKSLDCITGELLFFFSCCFQVVGLPGKASFRFLKSIGSCFLLSILLFIWRVSMLPKVRLLVLALTHC